MAQFFFVLNLHELVFLRFLNLEAVRNTQRINFTEDYILTKQGDHPFKYVKNCYRKCGQGGILPSSSDNTVIAY